MTTLINSNQVLQLYRSLIRYGQSLKLTDQRYYLRRVREEFRANKDLKAPEKIEFMYKVSISLFFMFWRIFFYDLIEYMIELMSKNDVHLMIVYY